MVDFIDLERLFLRLLESEAVRSQLQSDIGLVLVDEFQDVSPLQLAIFTRLRAIAGHSHWVGDEKQAIYGFRGSDPELVRRHWNLPPAGEKSTVDADARSQVRQLRKNYRSAAGLVALCGELFAEPLGAEARQIAVRADAGRVERWVIESKNLPTDLLRLSAGIASLIEEGTRAGDIAVLARSNPRLTAIAAELQQHGVRSRLEQPGLMRTREGALLMAGLRIVADRFDALAAATLCHILSDPTDSMPPWLDERLREVGAGDMMDRRELPGPLPARASGLRTVVDRPFPKLPWDGHPLLTRLRKIDPRCASPAAIAVEVVEALHLGEHKRRWGTPARRAGHIDTVLQFATGYEKTAADAGEPMTLAGFIHHVDKLAETEKDVRQPPIENDAVTLLTYHGAKGLEFPTVVLFDLDHDRQAEPWEMSVIGGGAAEDPTRGRILRYWPWPFGRNPRTGALLSGTGVELTARQSAEGQEASRVAHEESVRLLYVGFTRARDRLVLAHRASQSAWLNQLPSVDQWLPLSESSAREGGDSGARVQWNYRVRRLTEETSIAAAPDRADDWFDSGMPLRRSGPRGAAWHAPSRQDRAVDAQHIRIESTGAAAFFPAARDREEFRRVGDSVHAYLAALPSLSDCGQAVRIQCAERCVEKYGTAEWLSPQWLAEAGERFRRWTHSQWPGGTLMCEIPFAAARRAGGGWRGVADLLIETSDGEVVIVDHKSTPLRIEDCESAAASHSGQLAASREALSGAGLHLMAAYIHFPLAGRIAAMG